MTAAKDSDFSRLCFIIYLAKCIIYGKKNAVVDFGLKVN